MELSVGMIVNVESGATDPRIIAGVVERIWKKAYRVNGVTCKVDDRGWPIILAKENGLQTFSMADNKWTAPPWAVERTFYETAPDPKIPRRPPTRDQSRRSNRRGYIARVGDTGAEGGGEQIGVDSI